MSVSKEFNPVVNEKEIGKYSMGRNCACRKMGSGLILLIFLLLKLLKGGY